MMKKVLITGGAGFVPSTLADGLLATGEFNVVLVDNLLTGSLLNIPNHPNCYFIKCDVNDYNDISSVMNRYGFDYVFHYAAVVGVQRTLDNPNLVLKDIRGFENVFLLAKNTGVKRIFFSSSSEVYGEPVHLPQHEHETPLNSKLPYAVVKNIGECFCRTYKEEFNLDFTILRFFNTYGPKQSKDFVMSKFIDLAIKDQDITIYGTGDQTRTFCNIKDNVDFTVKILNDSLFVNDIVNVGSDKLTTIYSLAEDIIKYTNSNSKIISLPPLKEGDMTRRQPDITKMKLVMNREFISLEEGIKEIIKLK
jgi:nucleoside-diphosphate-sugar epimerase